MLGESRYNRLMRLYWAAAYAEMEDVSPGLKEICQVVKRVLKTEIDKGGYHAAIERSSQG